jgi:hypothetical protein
MHKVLQTRLLQLLVLLVLQQAATAQVTTAGSAKPLASFTPLKAGFPLVSKGLTAGIYVDAQADSGILRAATDLSKDILRVTGSQPILTTNVKCKHLLIAGTIGKSRPIDQLIKSGKLNVNNIRGSWENHLIEVIKNPFPGVEDALVIAGSDKRGTIYGLYTISSEIGVSPWYWWADVPVVKHKDIYIHPRRYSQGSPAVKYRGIFLNDEAPALSGWAKARYGGFNHKFYAQVFELILRLKGNYLWPAMWGSAFYADDPENARLANEYGIVIGTSHHEPLMRAHDEWRRFGKGPWNYNTNPATLKEFWKEGISRMGKNESVVTIGMRGDGDEPMSEGSNISLLEKIVADQRDIIQSVTGKEASKTPQVWALYKEVQDYYDKGMRVPDDVTLLLCDDNWGNLRKLPNLDAAPRAGGYGIYYHFDYVGGPRNYKWINTSPITKTWEQMHLAYAYQARQIWIVNVGDLKPMEFPISFFLDYAWNPDKLGADQLNDYTRNWATQQFGPKHAGEIASILSRYTKYNNRRKPELLSENTYSLQTYSEFERVVAEYRSLEKQAEQTGSQLQPEYKDAYYQLVLHPVQAATNLNQLYFAVAKNHQYAKEKRASTNLEAEQAKHFYQRDAEISRYYNDTLAKGKWTHLMDQTHIGYTNWQQPDSNKIPELQYLTPLPSPEMGLSFPGNGRELPEFNRYSKRKQYLDIYNLGLGSLSYKIQSPVSWIKVSRPAGQLTTEARLWLSIDWTKAPKKDDHLELTIKGAGKEKKVGISIKAYSTDIKGFVSEDGVIAIEAAHYTAKQNVKTADWRILPDYGRTESAVSTFPVTSASRNPGQPDSPVLEYLINLPHAGTFNVAAYLAPSLNFRNNKSLSYAVSIDDEKPQLVNINADASSRAGDKHVAENINIQTTRHQVSKPGAHRLKIWMVDAGIVLERLVVSPPDYREQSYLGPPESTYVN